jgi:hypothetical protein
MSRELCSIFSDFQRGASLEHSICAAQVIKFSTFVWLEVALYISGPTIDFLSKEKTSLVPCGYTDYWIADL